MVTIHEGSTFCICDELRDIGGGTTGLFAADTRFLSRLELTLDGARPLLLSSGRVEYLSAAFFATTCRAGSRKTSSRSTAGASSAPPGWPTRCC